MKELKDYKDSIYKCSKCGLCQAVCPLYQITGSDCTVSRGQFVMLKGVIKGDLKMSPKINRYLDLCLKCGKCTKFCPSGIDVLDVLSAAKYEVYKKSFSEKFSAFLKKHLLLGILPDIANIFTLKTKSKSFEKKVLYFGGCGSKVLGNKNVVSLLNSVNIEVVSPNFDCCGIWAYTNGNLEYFQEYIKSFVNVVKESGIYEIVTACASCEKTIKDYVRLAENETDREFLSQVKIKSIYSYIRENNLIFKLKTPAEVTFHKPCNEDNFEDIEWILKNTENLNYTETEGFDKCCGLNGLQNVREQGILKELYKSKKNSIVKSGVKIVLTTCLGCKATLSMYSGGQYKVYDLLDFLIKNSSKT